MKVDKIYITTDTHFSHKKLIEWGRPKDFEERLWKGFEVIKENDLLIHLGDFCIGNDELNHNLFMERVKGKKIFVRGNHDNKSNTWLYNHGWDFVCREFKDKFFGLSFTFTHIPIPKNETDYNIHGHTHGNMHRNIDVRDYYDKSFHIEIAPEIDNYQPTLLNQKIITK